MTNTPRRRRPRRETRSVVHPQRDALHERDDEADVEAAPEEIVQRTAGSPDAEASALSRADPGTRERAVRQLQAQRGNAYVQRMVALQRQPAGASPAVQTPAAPSPAVAPRPPAPAGAQGAAKPGVSSTDKTVIDAANTGEELYQRTHGAGLGAGADEYKEFNDPRFKSADDLNAAEERFNDLFEEKAYQIALWVLGENEKVALKELGRYNPAADADAYAREAAPANGAVSDFDNVPHNEQMGQMQAFAAELAPMQADLVARVRAVGQRALADYAKEVESRSFLSSVVSSIPVKRILLAKGMAEMTAERVEEFLDDSPDSIEHVIDKPTADEVRAIRDTQYARYANLKAVYGARFPILLARKTNFAELAAASPQQIQQYVAGRVDQVLTDIRAAREGLTRDMIWELSPLVSMTMGLMDITPQSGAAQMIQRKQKSRASASFLHGIMMTMLQIGVSLIPGVGMGLSLLIGAANFAADLSKMNLQSSLFGASLDPANRLAAEEPGYGWLALDIAGMVIDAGAMAASFRAVSRTMKGMDALGDATKGVKLLAAGEATSGAAEKAAANLAEVEEILRAQARVLNQEGKLAQGLSEELFVQRIMSGLRRQAASKGAIAEQQAGVLARVINGSHPNFSALLAGERNALRGLLVEHGNWKSLISGLERGGQESIAQALVKERALVVDDIRAELKALSRDGEALKVEPMGGASTEAVSDIDLQIVGPDAGEMFVQAEAAMVRRFGANWSETFRLNFYTEGARLTRYQEALSALKPAEKAAMTGRITQQAEQWNFARMLQHAGDNPQSLARVEKMAQQAGVDLAKIRPLAAMDEASKLARRNELLRKVDQLEAEYATAGGARKTALAEEISSSQMEANFLIPEANIGPGSLKFSGVAGLAKREAYQAALTHLEMIEHVIAEAGGDVARAAREYELFKYIARFGEAAEKAGIKTNWLNYYRNLGNAVYRQQRGLMEETAHQFIEPGPGIKELPQASGHLPPVTDEFLNEQFGRFMREAEEALPRMNSAAAPRARAGSVTAPQTPVRAAAATEGTAVRLVNRSTTERYLVVDSANPRFSAEGHLESGGELSLTLRTELDGARSEVLKGGEQFKAILDHFGSQVQGIRGAWSYGANLSKFNELTAGGMAAEEAALKTWTGEQSAAAGYLKATVRRMEGQPGSYTKVDVLFHK